MSVLLFGVSHRSAPVSVLEQLSTDESDQAKIVDQVLQSSLVTEAMVLSTCNRVEVYAVVEAFHGGLSVIGCRWCCWMVPSTVIGRSMSPGCARILRSDKEVSKFGSPAGQRLPWMTW